MIKMMAIWLDEDGLPRAYSTGYVNDYEDYQELESLADRMLDEYIASKPYPLNRKDFNFKLDVLDE